MLHQIVPLIENELNVKSLTESREHHVKTSQKYSIQKYQRYPLWSSRGREKVFKNIYRNHTVGKRLQIFQSNIPNCNF